MIAISFSFKPQVKSKKTKTNSVRKSNKPSKPKDKVLNKDMTGTLILLNSYKTIDVNDGCVFFANIDGIKNPVKIDKSCYICKNKKTTYRLTNNGFIRYDRLGDLLDNLPKCFTPFAPGFIVQGDIIKTVDDDITFKIKKVL